MQQHESSEEEFFIGFVDFQINCTCHKFKFKIDSGADVSVMSSSTYESMRDAPIWRPTSHRLNGVNAMEY